MAEQTIDIGIEDVIKVTVNEVKKKFDEFLAAPSYLETSEYPTIGDCDDYIESGVKIHPMPDIHVTNKKDDTVVQNLKLVHPITPENDPVNHPNHYTDGIEVIDYIESKNLPYHLGNAVKYISRAGKKDPDKTIEDLQKAVWYINRYIELVQKEKKDDHDSVRLSGT